MKKCFYLCMASILLASVFNAQAAIEKIPLQDVQAVLNKPAQPHPRLFLTDAQIPSARQRIESNMILKSYYTGLLKRADAELSQKPVERIKTGRRLLDVSRRCLYRVFLWSMAYRFEGDKKYLDRAEQEMLAAAAFSDWNPSHFLDVGEMTAGLAIGYDWLYNDLPESSRTAIRQAIIEKGIVPSLPSEDVQSPNKNPGWAYGNNNWNQVCNGGMTLGALAVVEDEPALSEKIIYRAVNGVQVAMEEYEPDGTYPEGPGYWSYGTTYNVILLAAMDSALGTDFGLSQKNGFSKCADYYLHVCGPTGLYFNYPDSGKNKSLTPAVFWFAQKYNETSVAWNEYMYWMKALKEHPGSLYSDRVAPLTLLWAAAPPAAPRQTCWMGRGKSPVALLRTSWTDPGAVFLGFKGGSPGVNHGHMDVGSFVLDADGVRWAMDLGPEDYNKIESLGMNLWSSSPDSDRWTIFRYNNSSHNTLVVNGQHQIIKAVAPIIRYSDKAEFAHAAIDMSKVYGDQLETAIRGAALLPTGQVLIQDDLKALDAPATVRWAMATPATVQIQSDRIAKLTQKGKTLTLEILAPDGIKLLTYSAEPKADYDEPNPGVVMLGFETELNARQDARLAVVMTPQSSKETKDMQLKSVLEWSKPLD